jgi:hypothetical protein
MKKRRLLIVVLVLCVASGLVAYLLTRPSVPPGYDAVVEGMSSAEVQATLQREPFFGGQRQAYKGTELVTTGTFQMYEVDGFRVEVQYDTRDGMTSKQLFPPEPLLTRITDWLYSWWPAAPATTPVLMPPPMPK